MSAEVIHGDCLEVMRGLDPETMDSIVTDPPYHLTQASRGGSAREPGTGPFGRHRVGEKGFMGKTWDGGGVAFRVELWEEALRIAKPGTYLLAFGGTRTYHRMTCAIEDAGWEIHDCLTWLYGSGFPKHKSKLKPAWEPVVMARKPAPRSTPLNIDACRLEGVPPSVPQPVFNSPTGLTYGFKTGEGRNGEMSHASGRWPANVCVDEEAAAMIDAQSGETRSTSPGSFQRELTSRGYPGGGVGQRLAKDHSPVDLAKPGYGDTGGASRFYYCAKSSRAEREAGLAGLVRRPGGSNAKGFTDDVARGLDRNRPVANSHPTVKPVALMRWLIRLVTPPDGIVLDPFTGSGTTGIAAIQEGRRFVGIEREAEYVEIARARIAHAQPSLGVA